MITVKKSDINVALKKLTKIAAKKATMPLLNHIAVSFDGELLTLTANDTSSTYSAIIDAKGDPCQLTMEAAKMASAVNAMRSGDIEIKEGQIKQGRSKIKIDCGNYDQFPQPDYAQAKDAGCSAETLSAALSKVHHAMGTDDVRYYLNGVYVGNGATVATNGHRMAWADLEFDGVIIIPESAVRQIIGMTGEVTLSESQLVITNDSERFSTKLIEAKYPDWKRVIPSGDYISISGNSEEIIETLNAVQIGGEMGKFEVSKDSVLVSNSGAEAGFNCESTGSMVVGFSIRYVIDAIKSLNEESVTIKLYAENKPCVVGDSNVVMPVRL